MHYSLLSGATEELLSNYQPPQILDHATVI